VQRYLETMRRPKLIVLTFCVSLLAHVTLAGHLLSQPIEKIKPPPPKTQNQSQNYHILPFMHGSRVAHDQSVELVEAPSPVLVEEKKPEVKSPEKILNVSKSESCKGKKTYDGIGAKMVANPDGSDSFKEVFPNYPADRAGVKAGDKILRKSGILMGAKGTPVQITVKRGDRTLNMTIVRQSICYEDATPTPP
jgi:hypothetical protein